LRDEDQTLRWRAAKALGDLGLKTPAVIDALCQALRDEDINVRLCAAYSLGQIGSEAKAAMPGLLALLDEPGVASTSHACFAIRRIGPAAKEAVPALRAMLTDIDCASNEAVADALLAIDPQGVKSTIEGLIDGLDSQERDMRRAAVRSIGQLDTEGKYLPRLIRALNDPDDVVRCDVVKSLERMGSLAKPAVPALLKLLKDKDRDVRTHAAEALLVIDPKAAAKAGVD
jgi:HEAT repeat protein